MKLPTPDDYALLEIRIRPLGAGGYPVEMTLAGEQELAPGALDGTLVQQVRKARWEPRQGEVLFERLFSDPRLRSAWDRARGTGRSLRLRLRIDPEAPELQALPWEAMASVAAGSLSSGAATPFSRYLACERKHGEPVRERPIRILAAIACPHDLAEHGLTRFDVEAQRRALAAALAGSRARRQVELSFLEPPVSPARLAQGLRELRPHVVHLVAHGKLNPAGAALYLEAAGGGVEQLYDAQLAALLGRLEILPRLTFLAACESAGDSLADAFQGFAPRLVQTGVPAVLAMQGKAPIELASEFAAVFYRQLLAHGLVDLATNEARAQVLTAELAGASCPVLYLRLKNGLLLEPSAALAELDLAAYREHQRRVLTTKTQCQVPLAVDEVVAHGGRIERVPHTAGPLAERVCRHPRITLLGVAGAGKSSSLELLARGCFETYSPLAGLLPVVVKLGSLAARGDAGELILGLIARALYEGHAAADPPPLAGVRAFLETGPELLILIDGLNEVPSELRPALGQAIEKLAQRYERHRYVLSTRPHAFRPLSGWAACELRPLDDGQMEEVLRRGAGEAACEQLLKTVLDTGSSLLRLPLFLGFVIELRHDRQRLGRGIGSRAGILRAYADKLMRQDVGGDSVGMERLCAALGCLAETLRNRGKQLEVQEARDALAVNFGLDDTAVAKLVEELLQRGFLVEDNGFLEFWHQTFQEYFYAGAFVDRWRKNLRTRFSLGTLQTLRQRLTGAQDDALTLATAHLRDEELEPVLRLGLRSNPRLALAWVDDLSTEQRAPLACQRFLHHVDCFARMGRLLTGTRSTRWLVIGLSAGAVLLEVSLGLIVALLGARRQLAQRLLASALPRIDSLHRPTLEQLETFFLAIPTLRHEGLRARLQLVAAEVAASPMLPATTIRDAAELARQLGKLELEKIIDLIDSNPERPNRAAVRALAMIPDARARAFLEKMVSPTHPLRERALAALASRAKRFSIEREATEKLMTKVVAEPGLDSGVRTRAYLHLTRRGCAPLLRRLLDRAFFIDALRRFGTKSILLAFVLLFGGPFGLLLAGLSRPLSLTKALMIVTALKLVATSGLGVLSDVANAGWWGAWNKITPLLGVVSLLAGLIAVDLWRLGAKRLPSFWRHKVPVALLIGGLTVLLGALLWIQRGSTTGSTLSVSGLTSSVYLWLALLAGVYWLHRHELRTPGAAEA